MSNPAWQTWENYRGRIRSKIGKWTPGQGVSCYGFDMMEELVGQYSYMQVIILNATGKMPSLALAQWFEAMHICLSWPDPRIWCNRIGAIAGSNRISPVGATCAGLLAADSRIYGMGTAESGMAFIQDALQQYKNLDCNIEKLVDKKLSSKGGKAHFMGYARPLATGDERIPAMEKVCKNLNLQGGEHLDLAYEIEQELDKRFNETMNINGYACAFLADYHFTGKEIYRIFSTLVASGVNACYADAENRTCGTFSPLHAEDIRYTGESIRPLPKK